MKGTQKRFVWAAILRVLLGAGLLATLALPAYWLVNEWTAVEARPMRIVIGVWDVIEESSNFFGNWISPCLLLGFAVSVPALGLFLIAQAVTRAGLRWRYGRSGF
jgi:hypothetical protein